MRLEKFTKNKKQKRIVIGSIVGILLLIGGITLYRTFAMYKVEKSFDVLNGTVPPFINGDLQLAVTVDGEKKETIPTKSDKNYGVVVACDNAKGSWDKDKWQAVLGDFTGNKVKCHLYFESTLSGYIKALSKIDESILEEEHEATEQTPKLTDYRYVGAKPNNYVCFEEDNKTCTDDNLYRIIGVIPTQKDESGSYEDRVKLIKNTSYGNTYTWGNDNNTLNGEWSAMDLNTKILNQEYWESISPYQKYIDNAKWYLGKTHSWMTIPLTHYKNERVNNMGYDDYATSIIANVALFNGSDYYFATSGGNVTNRNECLNTYNWNEDNKDDKNNDCRNNNWLFDNLKKYWTINLGSQESSYYNVMTFQITGTIINTPINSRNTYIKPSFYLKKDVLYKSGDGSYNNPYHITI